MSKPKLNLDNRFSDLSPSDVSNNNTNDVLISSTRHLLKLIPLNQLVSKENIRLDPALDQNFINSINDDGIIQALTVIPDQDKQGYSIIAGHRRHAALLHLQKPDDFPVPCMIRQDILDTVTRIKIQFSENKQRMNLTTKDEYNAIAYLSNEAGLSQRDIAKFLNIDHTYISKILSINTLPPDQQKIAFSLPKSVASEFAVAPAEARENLKIKSDIKAKDIRKAVSKNPDQDIMQYVNELENFKIIVYYDPKNTMPIEDILYNGIDNKDQFKKRER